MLMPVALLFPVIGLLGSTHEAWPGALLRTVQYIRIIFMHIFIDRLTVLGYGP